MTALALHGRSLNFRGKSKLHLDFRGKSKLHLAPALLRYPMGPLERTRLKTVLAQAEQLGIQGSIPETLRDPRLVHVLSRQFKVPVPSQESCQRYYRDHWEQFREPDRYIGRQILLRPPGGEAAAHQEAWARAERLIAILFFDPNMFDDLVATYDSIHDGSASARIGPVVRGQLPPELDMALFGLRPGQIFPAPIASGQGIHIVMLDRILPGDVMPFPVVHGRISAALRAELRSAAARRHLTRLAERYKAAAE